MTGHFGFVWGKFGQRNHIIVRSSFYKKAPFSKCLLSKRKRKASVFKPFRFEKRFWKPPFSWRISVHCRPNRRNKAAFSNPPRVVWRGLKGSRKFGRNLGAVLHFIDFEKDWAVFLKLHGFEDSASIWTWSTWGANVWKSYQYSFFIKMSFRKSF